LSETPAQDGEPPRGEAQAPFLRLYLLGRFEVVRQDAPIPAHAWRRRRPADLLRLVALAPGRVLSRERVVETLWPDKDPASGANNLHRALYDLRQVLGGRWVDIERGQVALDSAAWVDVDAFLLAAAAGTLPRLAEAVTLYRGELAPGSPEPWLAERRAELRRTFVDAALPLARAAAEAGDLAAGVPLARRLVDVDSLGEEGHRLLVRLLALSGRRAEALRACDACEGALRAAGRGPPSEELRALRLAVQQGALGPVEGRQAVDGARRAARRLLGTPDPPPVRGRNAMLLALESLVERGAGMLVVLGERGAGKTRLALEGARFAQGRGAAVLSATATAFPGSPYGVFVDLFRQERGDAGLDPLATEHATSTEVARLRIHQAVVTGLQEIAGGRPVFLILDDLHAADESSLSLLHYLAARAAELRLMVVATCRDDEIHGGTPIQTALSHLDSARLARGLRLPRLSLAGTREQVTDLLGVPPGEPLLAQIYRATDGSPFLVEEAVRAHREFQQVPADPLTALRARVARLGPRAEALLAAAAVAGRRFDFDLVRPASGLAAQDAVRTLEECLAAGVVDEDGNGYLFRHDLVRDALYDALPAGRRGALHATLADLLEGGPLAAEHPEVLARHRRLAGQGDRALRHLVAAGHRAADRACLSEALGFYGEALELAPRLPADAPLQRELLDAAGRTQLALGELAGAARSFGHAAGIQDAEGQPGEPGTRAGTLRLAATSLAASGDLPGAIAHIEEGLAAAGDQAGDERAALLLLLGQLLFHQGHADQAVGAGAACAEAAERVGDHELGALGRDLAALASGRATEEAPQPGPGHAPEPGAAEPPLEVHLSLWDGDLLGDRASAELAQAAAAVTERARRRHLPEAIASGLYGEGIAALAASQLEAAELLLREAQRRFGGANSATGEALTRLRLATLYIVLGRLEEADRLLGEAVLLAERGLLRRHLITRIHAAEVRQRLATGRPGEAEAAAREASESAARHGECVICDAAFRPEVIRTALAFGRLEEAELEARALEDIARQRGGRGLLALARFSRARVLAGRGRVEDALVSLAQARAGFLAGGMRYEAARTTRLEARLRGSLPEAWRALDALVRVDADA